MTSQIIICMAIFVVTLISYMLNKIPMWVTAMLSMAALYITGCIDDTGALSGFANNNTILMATMFMVAAGFRRTSLVETMCNGLLRLTKGSFQKAYVGYLLLGALLTNFISSPMVVYAIVSPLMAALCDKVGQSRSKYMFPLMIVCVSCCGILPLPSAITGFMETYGFTGMTFQPIYFFLGAWPVLLIVVAWSAILGPKFCPAEPVIPIATKAQGGAQTQKQLSPFADKNGYLPVLRHRHPADLLRSAEADHLVGLPDGGSADGAVRRAGQQNRPAGHSLGYADAVRRRSGPGYRPDQHRRR